MAAAHVQKRPKRSADHIPRSLDEFMERHNVVKEKRSHAKCPAPYYRNFFLTNYSLMKLDCYIRDVIAADGKETHNTGKKNSKDPTQRRNLNEFNVMSTEWGISLSSTRIDEKSNEIPEMQKVMKQIDCRGCVVTADAMNTQKATAKLFAIVARRHWNIENGLHWVLDIVFKEDQLRSKEKNGIHNLGLVRRFVMFIIKLLKVYYHRSMKRIRNKIGSNLFVRLF